MKQTDRIFLDILKAALQGARYEPAEQISGEMWNQIVTTAQQHQLLPMIFEACYHLPGLSGTQLQAVSRQIVMREVFMQTRKTGEFLSLFAALRAAGATPLVVKGIVCRSLYPQPDYRTSNDEDVLIPPEQFALCHEILLQRGMETPEDADRFDKVYEIPYGKKGSPLYIELHKSLFPPESDAYGDLNEFFEGVHHRAVEVACDGGTVMTMAPTDHLFYLICHAFKHFLHGGFGIRQVCDIVLFGKHHKESVDWRRVRDNCTAIRADQFTRALFAIGQKHLGLGAVLPEDWQADVDEQAMLEDLLASGIYGGSEMERKHSSNITLHAVARQKQGKTEGGGVLHSLFPKADALAGRYPYLKKFPFLLPVAWICRILSFLFRRGGADSAAKTVQLGNERIELLKQYGILEE